MVGDCSRKETCDLVSTDFDSTHLNDHCIHEPSNKDSGFAGTQSISQATRSTLFERRQKKGRIDPIRLDCIRPFTSKSDTICVLSAPATHIRLQTVPCGDGFVVHRCIDIRTHEFFLHPERAEVKSTPLLPLAAADSVETMFSRGSSDSAVFGAPPTCCRDCNDGSAAAIKSESEAVPAAPANLETLAAAAAAASAAEASAAASLESTGLTGGRGEASPKLNASERRLPGSIGRFPPASRQDGCGSGSGSSSSSFKRRSGDGSMPGTPCNVEAVAWLVGAAAAALVSSAPNAAQRSPDDSSATVDGAGGGQAAPALDELRPPQPADGPLGPSAATPADGPALVGGSGESAVEEAARRKRARRV